jgi:hypothetical protein
MGGLQSFDVPPKFSPWEKGQCIPTRRYNGHIEPVLFTMVLMLPSHVTLGTFTSLPLPPFCTREPMKASSKGYLGLLSGAGNTECLWHRAWPCKHH